MRFLELIGLFLPTFLFAFGSGLGSKYSNKYDPSKLPAAPSCTVKVKDTIKVKGSLDGKGCLYKWVGKYADKCHSEKEYSESVPSMFDMEPNSTLKNMHIECAPDGITTNDNTVIENIVVRDCEEDCLNTKGKNITIKNSKFFFGQDKCFQMNKAENVKITNNEFHYCARGISGSGSTMGGARGVIIEGNKFINNEIAIRAQSNHEFFIRKNTCKNSDEFLETVEKAVIYDAKNNTNDGCKYLAKDGTQNVKPWN